MKVLLASSSLLAIPTLEFISHADLKFLGIISMPDAPQGRGRVIAENSFAAKARDLGIQVFKPRNHDELFDTLTSTDADLVVTISYGRLIRSRELVKPKYGWLNIHFSLLPRWRGAAPAQRAIEAGDSKTGVTVFKLDEGLDTGPIYSIAEYEMRGDEDSQSLLEKLSTLSTLPLSKAIEMISMNIQPTSQAEEGSSSAPKLSKEEGRLNWNCPNVELERKIRAFSPWPTTWTQLGDSRISILKARVSSEKLSPGSIMADQVLIVGCGEGSLEILSLKPEGKREMTAAEWLRGARLKPDSFFQ